MENFDRDKHCHQCGVAPQWDNPLVETNFCRWCQYKKGCVDSTRVHFDTLVRIAGAEKARQIVAIDPSVERLRRE